jgi:hypothetical protein
MRRDARHTGIDGRRGSEPVRRIRDGQRQCRRDAEVDDSDHDVIGDVERYLDGYFGVGYWWFGRLFCGRPIAGGNTEQLVAGAPLGEPMHRIGLPDQHRRRYRIRRLSRSAVGGTRESL